MKKKWQVFVALFGIFLLGAVAGAVVAVPIVQKREAAKRRAGPEQFGPSMMKRFVQQLELSEEQKAKVEPIVKSAADQLRDFRRDALTKTNQVLDAMHADVAKELTPQQREKLKVMQEKQRERMREWMSRDRRGDDRKGSKPHTPDGVPHESPDGSKRPRQEPNL